MSVLFYAVRYNLMGLIFFGAALYFAKRGGTFWHWYVIALLLQGYSVFGAILGICMEPEQWRTPGIYCAIGLFAVLAIAVGLLLWRSEKRDPSRDRKARIAAAMAEAQRKQGKKR